MQTQLSSSETLSFEKVWRMFQKSGEEADKRSREIDKRFQETDKKIQETSREITQLERLFKGQWCKLMEALMSPSFVNLFQKRDIPVNQMFPNAISHRNGETMEIDNLLVNGKDAVVVEIKTTAGPSDVRDIIDDLKNFRRFFPQYTNANLIGAIASLKYNGKSDTFAARRGLYVIKLTGENIATIANKPAFKHKLF